jgi:hypothetical protein
MKILFLASDVKEISNRCFYTIAYNMEMFLFFGLGNDVMQNDFSFKNR